MLVAFVCYEVDELPAYFREKHIEDLIEDGRGVLVIEYNGKPLSYHVDSGEPEDNTFYRDYSWVDEAINKAYEMGVEDGKNDNY